MLHAHVARVLRAAPPLALAASLFVTTLGAPAPATVAAAPAEPAARLQLVVKQVEILDDREGWLSGKGEMTLWVWIQRCTDGVPPPCQLQHVTMSFWTEDFAARTGDVVSVGLIMPGERTKDNAEEGVTPELGFPVLPGEQYAVHFEMMEWDDGFTAPEDMGEVDHPLSTGDYGLDIGTHVGRATGASGGHIGDFIVTYEIRRIPLPDLHPVNVKVHDLPGSDRKRVCMAVQNVGLGNPGPHEVALHVDAVVPPGGRTIATGPVSGTSHEVCVEVVLPTLGQHSLMVVVDEPGALTEYDETNNVDVHLYQATGPTIPATPTPGAALPNLTVSAIKVNGRVPDGKDDCKEGKNSVTVVVKNAGTADADAFVVQLAVDTSDDDVKEKSVSGLKAGQEREVSFGDVRLKKGSHTLSATVDGKEESAESNKGNNASTVPVGCRGND